METLYVLILVVLALLSVEGHSKYHRLGKLRAVTLDTIIFNMSKGARGQIRYDVI